MTINRYWYELTCVLPPYQYSPCGCLPGGPQAFSTSGPVAVTCGSISWSGPLTQVSGNLPDPVGGDASFSGDALGESICCQDFKVYGCNNCLLQQITVSVYASFGGALLASGITNSSGIVRLSWVGPCTVYVTITASRFASYGQTLTLTTGGGTNVTMTPASGYYCLQSTCVYPEPATLYLTDSTFGSVTLTYDGTQESWVGTACVTYTPDATEVSCCCGGTAGVPVTLQVYYYWNAGFGMYDCNTVGCSGCGGPPPSGWCANPNALPNLMTCYIPGFSSFSATISAPSQYFLFTSSCSNILPWCVNDYPGGPGTTFTVTE